MLEQLTNKNIRVKGALSRVFSIFLNNLVPRAFPFELGRREKTLASAGHVPILHPKILGVIN